MTTGGTSPGGGYPNDPHQPGPGQPDSGVGYGQEPYPGQGYGQEPYPGQGYGAPQGSGFHPAAGPGGPVPTRGVSPIDAISAGWQLFKNNPVPWVVIMVGLLVAGFITGQLSRSGSPAAASLGMVLSVAVSILAQAFILRGALLEVDGHRPQLGQFFTLHNIGAFVLAYILVFIAVFVGTLLLILPGLAAAFLLYWTLTFVIDRNMTATDAMTSSFNAIKSDAGNLLGLAVLNSLIIVAGFLVFGLGLIVAMPVATLASVFAYRAITGPSEFSRSAPGGF